MYYKCMLMTLGYRQCMLFSCLWVCARTPLHNANTAWCVHRILQLKTTPKTCSNMAKGLQSQIQYASNHTKMPQVNFIYNREEFYRV